MEVTENMTGCHLRPAPSPVQSDRHNKSRERHLLGSIQPLASTIVIAVFVITFIVQAFQIPSESMENTLLIGDYLLVDKVRFARGGNRDGVLPYRGIQRGDIIVFRYPVHPVQHFVKRVVGLPGDRVRIVHKKVIVNGQALREEYAVYRSVVPDPYRDDFPSPNLLNGNVDSRWWIQMRQLARGGELTVPPGQYFVLGDNRDESLDSRYWGFVPRENILGRPLLIYWSMRRPDRMNLGPASPLERLEQFAYTVTHLFQQARWNRTFRMVH